MYLSAVRRSWLSKQGCRTCAFQVRMYMVHTNIFCTYVHTTHTCAARVCVCSEPSYYSVYVSAFCSIMWFVLVLQNTAVLLRRAETCISYQVPGKYTDIISSTTAAACKQLHHPPVDRRSEDTETAVICTYISYHGSS